MFTPRRSLPSVLPAALAALLTLWGAACAGPRPHEGETAREAAGTVSAAAAEPGEPGRPLAMLASQRALLVPVQRVAADSGLGVTATALDAELAFALEERGVGATWTTAAAARRLASQNPSYTSDPARLSLPPGTRLRAGDPVREPLASQLRSLAALADSRFAVVPEEVRAETTGGAAHAVLRLLLVDVRQSQVLWAGQTAGVPLAGTAPAARALRVAGQFVDLVAAPPEP